MALEGLVEEHNIVLDFHVALYKLFLRGRFVDEQIA